MNTNATYADTEPMKDENIYQTAPSGASHSLPYIISLPVDRHLIRFEIDTGSAVSLINEASLQKLPRLRPADTTFRSYTGQSVDVRGVFTAEVEHSGGVYHLPVHVVRGSRHPNLLGRNWIKSRPSVFSYVNQLKSSTAVDCLLFKYQELFEDNLLSHYRGMPMKFEFKPEHQPRFFKARSVPALSSSAVLVHYDPANPLILKCDASPYGLGAVIMHRMASGQEMPITFASRTMSQAENNYSQLDKEALAIMFGLNRFHLYLFGREFEIHIDHKPLLGLMGEARGIQQMASPRMQRWALTLSSYSYVMKYIKGNTNQVADALSRLPIVDNAGNRAPPFEAVNLLQHMVNAPVTSQRISQWTARDPLLAQVKRALQVGWPNGNSPPELKPYSMRQNELSLQDGCVLWGNRIVVPPQGRQIILRDLHNAHPGIVKMTALARSYVWWPGMDAEIEQMVKMCSICQRTQQATPKVPLKPWSWPDSPWKRIHIDYFGPFLGQMVLVVVDAHTKWIEAIPTGNSCSSATTINKLRCIFSTFGIPEMIVSDNGPAFSSSEFKEFIEKNGIRHLTTAPYHAASNGLA